MPKFIQKLVTVEAVQFTGENMDEVLAFCSICFRSGKELRMKRYGVILDEPEERKSFALTPGAWIAKNPDGSFLPCSTSFLDYYEPIPK